MGHLGGGLFAGRAPDGYPKRIWDKRTGVIDPQVAAHWRENYDLAPHPAARLGARAWARSSQGKIHIYVGDMDNYYLNNAVYLVEEFLKATQDPHYGGEVDYGDRAEHCWNGDHTRPNAISRLRYHQMFAPKIVERIEKSAPPGRGPEELAILRPGESVRECAIQQAHHADGQANQ